MKVTMIARGVEISSARRGGEIVGAYLLVGFFFSFVFFVIMHYLFWVQKALCSGSCEEKITYKS